MDVRLSQIRCGANYAQYQKNLTLGCYGALRIVFRFMGVLRFFLYEAYLYPRPLQ